MVLSSPMRYLACLAAASLCCGTAGAAILHVDGNATGGDGSTWCLAFTDLQPALNAAHPGDTIRIADGTYLADTSGRPDPRSATFLMLNGVTLEGGYAGCGAPDPDHRDRLAYTTVLSGDLAGDDEPGFVNNSENVFHVVTASGTDPTAVLDGVTIAAGHADVWPTNRGGGLLSNGGSPTLRRVVFRENMAENDYASGGGMYVANGEPLLEGCSFVGNRVHAQGGGIAHGRGGGMYNESSEPVLRDCLFVENEATGFLPGGAGLYNSTSRPEIHGCRFVDNRTAGLGAQGGAMVNSGGSDPTLDRCVFIGNLSEGAGFQGGSGGALFNYGSPVMINCVFLGNGSGVHWGAVYNDGASPTLFNNLFSGNVAGTDDNGSGGAMFNAFGSDPLLMNCTLAANLAASGEFANGFGGGLHNFGDSHPTLVNSILWDNEDFGGKDESAQIHNDTSSGTSSATVDYSCVQGGWSAGGDGNIDDDPLFVDSEGPDMLPGTEDDNLRLAPGSPTIDTGDNFAVGIQLDLDMRMRIMDGTVDMGAYEYAGPPAGAVPNNDTVPGAPLTVDKAAAGEVDLAWSPSCLASDVDYAIYEGAIGDFTSHVPTTCSTLGATSFRIAPAVGSRYFLIVPGGGGTEGSYGIDGGGAQRPASASPCAIQSIGACP